MNWRINTTGPASGPRAWAIANTKGASCLLHAFRIGYTRATALFNAKTSALLIRIAALPSPMSASPYLGAMPPIAKAITAFTVAFAIDIGHILRPRLIGTGIRDKPFQRSQFEPPPLRWRRGPHTHKIAWLSKWRCNMNIFSCRVGGTRVDIHEGWT